MKPKKTIIEKSILMVPLMLAFVWMGFLVLNVEGPSEGMKLAPSRLDSLVNALFAFIVVYAVVLVVVFVKMNKAIKKELPKKVKKDKKK